MIILSSEDDSPEQQSDCEIDDSALHNLQHDSSLIVLNPNHSSKGLLYTASQHNFDILDSSSDEVKPKKEETDLRLSELDSLPLAF